MAGPYLWGPVLFFMNIIIVKRVKYLENCTIGELYLNEVFQCFTLEDKFREIKNTPVEKWKVYGKTAIPTGRYDIKLTMSNRFKILTPELSMVNGFVGVRIHSGNTDKDTEGCILVGETWDKISPTILDSKLAFQKLMIKLKTIDYSKIIIL